MSTYLPERPSRDHLVRMAIPCAIDNQRASVTFLHKGKIMKHTEGAINCWGCKMGRDAFGGQVVTEDELWEKYNGQTPEGRVVIKGRGADVMFQQILLRNGLIGAIQKNK